MLSHEALNKREAPGKGLARPRRTSLASVDPIKGGLG